MAMTPQLKASFSDEERGVAAALGTAAGGSLDGKIEELFRTLGDPLLSAEDTTSLLVARDEASVAEAMQRLTQAGVLESSRKTQRPLDGADVELPSAFRYGGGNARLRKVDSAARDHSSGLDVRINCRPRHNDDIVFLAGRNSLLQIDGPCKDSRHHVARRLLKLRYQFLVSFFSGLSGQHLDFGRMRHS